MGLGAGGAAPTGSLSIAKKAAGLAATETRRQNTAEPAPRSIIGKTARVQEERQRQQQAATTTTTTKE
jgi:hypothetical protein